MEVAGRQADEAREGEGEMPLEEEQLWELAGIGKKIERDFGCEQDIEWCYNKDGFFIVQARPITTLYPLPPSPDGYKHCAISVGHLQMMTDGVLWVCPCSK